MTKLSPKIFALIFCLILLSFSFLIVLTGDPTAYFVNLTYYEIEIDESQMPINFELNFNIIINQNVELENHPCPSIYEVHPLDPQSYKGELVVYTKYESSSIGCLQYHELRNKLLTKLNFSLKVGMIPDICSFIISRPDIEQSQVLELNVNDGTPYTYQITDL